jgi:hypothetical protein
VTHPVALLVFAPLVFVGGFLSALRLDAKPPSLTWVLSGYVILAVTVTEPLYFLYENFFSFDVIWGDLLNPVLLPFWVMALVFLAAILATAYAIAAQKWGRGEHGRMLLAGFMAVLFLYALSVVFRLAIFYPGASGAPL